MGTKLTNDEFKARIYDIFGDDVILLDEYRGSKQQITIMYHPLDMQGSTTAGSLLLGILPKNIKDCTSYRKDKTFSQENFVSKLKKINPNITVGEYIGADKPIDCQCKKCCQRWKTRASALTSNKTGCPYCVGQKAIVGVNDLWTTRPDVASMLKYTNAGYSLMEFSKSKEKFICKQCGTENIYTVAKVSANVYGCSCCSDGVSYPNKFMYSLLKQLNIEFETEYSPEWIKPYRFDFFIPDLNLIIEVDGGLGHGKRVHSSSKTTLEKTIERDKYKDKQATQYNLQVIRVNADISELNFLKNSILSCDLSLYFDMSNIDWTLCDTNASKSILVTICNMWNKNNPISNIANELMLSRCTIIKYLHKGNMHNLCIYNPSKIHHSKSVMCVTTEELFDSLKEAKLKYNAYNISKVCKGYTNYKTSGKHPITGEALVWRYYTEKEDKSA